MGFVLRNLIQPKSIFAVYFYVFGPILRRSINSTVEIKCIYCAREKHCFTASHKNNASSAISRELLACGFNLYILLRFRFSHGCSYWEKFFMGTHHIIRAWKFNTPLSVHPRGSIISNFFTTLLTYYISWYHESSSRYTKIRIVSVYFRLELCINIVIWEYFDLTLTGFISNLNYVQVSFVNCVFSISLEFNSFKEFINTSTKLKRPISKA